jgi:3-hydroxyisobutyrate dehydrogenase-like beta-hydroxyacid dehydrogenase
LADALNDLGARIEVISDRPGDAAARKLLRSIVTKGLTSLLIESLEAAEARGDSEWMWQHLVDLLTGTDEDFMRRLVEGTPQHVDRRLVEMESAVAFLESLDVSPTMTAATVDALSRVRHEGLRDTILPLPRA